MYLYTFIGQQCYKYDLENKLASAKVISKPFILAKMLMTPLSKLHSLVINMAHTFLAVLC